MNLFEFEGKELLVKYGVPVPTGKVCNSIEEIEEYIKGKNVKEWALKAQVPTGKRGKNGGILFANEKNIVKRAEKLFGKDIKGYAVSYILVDEKIEIQKELYLSITLDRANRQFVWVFAKDGGMEIEEIAKSNPKNIIKKSIKIDRTFPSMEAKDALKGEFSEDIISKIVEVSENCWKVTQEKEALLVEINPLMLTKDGEIIAGDAKIVLDENAGYRQEDMWQYKQSKRSIAEDQSHEKGIPFVELDGEIGVIGNGAGLVMATLDMINEFGGTPANFLDIGGGASKEKTLEALGIVLKSEKPKGLIVNIFGGITHCDTVAEAIVESVKESGKDIPIVIRMVGTNEEQAGEILDKAGIHFYTTMEKAVKKIISLIKET